MPKYKVQAFWSKQCEGTIEVEAESEEEARGTALEDVEESPDDTEFENWDMEGWQEWEVQLANPD